MNDEWTDEDQPIVLDHQTTMSNEDGSTIFYRFSIAARWGQATAGRIILQIVMDTTLAHN